MAKAKLLAQRTRLLDLLMIALIGMVFSYQPLLQLGNVAGVHIDISLSYVLIGLAILFALPIIWKRRSELYYSRVWLLLAALVVYLTISTIWSPNPVRGTLTSLFWLAILALVSVVMLHAKLLRQNKDKFLRWASIAYKLIIIWALWQLVADAFGISTLYSLLPVAYSGDVFGFARPTGFALEPQFLGSLLLIPFGWLSYRIFNNRATAQELALYIAIVCKLLLTLSRGALFSSVVIVLTLIVITHPPIRAVAKCGFLVFAGMVSASILIFCIAEARTNDDISGTQAIGRAINHLTLGTSIITVSNVVQPNAVHASTPATSGYVRVSTDSRVSQARQAIDVWQTSPATLLFGVGVGGFGVASESKQPGAIVNNYYLELLAEGGLIAFTLFMAALSMLLLKLARNKEWLVLTLLIGLFLQALFYSGNANILHIWALVGLALGLVKLNKNVKAKSVSLLQ